MDFEEEYFKNYKEQSFKYGFWSKYIKKRIQKEDKILEIGCSYGFLFKYLKEYKNKIGTDISVHAIEKAKKINPNDKFKIMDAEKLNFEERTFNLILAFDILEHLNNPENCIKEVARVLKKGGVLILTTPNPDSYSKKIKKENWFAYKDPTHISINSSKFWCNLLVKNDFSIEKNTTIDLFDFPYINKVFILLNLISYKIKKPFIKKIGDNTLIIAKKE